MVRNYVNGTTIPGVHRPAGEGSINSFVAYVTVPDRGAAPAGADFTRRIRVLHLCHRPEAVIRHPSGWSGRVAEFTRLAGLGRDCLSTGRFADAGR